MHRNGISSNLLQSDTSDSTYLRAEIVFQQALAQSDTLKNLGSPVAADGRDAHFRHNLEEPFFHSLDIVRLRSRVVFLYLVSFHQIVENSKSHIRTECRSTIAQ